MPDPVIFLIVAAVFALLWEKIPAKVRAAMGGLLLMLITARIILGLLGVL